MVYFQFLKVSFGLREAKVSALVPLRCRGGAEQQRRSSEEVMFSPPLGVTVSSV